MTRLDDFKNQKSGSRSKSSLLQRITLLSLIMAMLVAAAGAISYRFAGGAETDIKIMNQAASQAVQISEMQSSWLSVVGTLDTISITRPAEGVKEKLDKYLAELNQKLETLADTQLGFSSATIAENQTITTELKVVGSEVADLANEIYSLSEQGRWGTALQRRQVKLAELQTRLDNGLERLNSNLQSELAARSYQAQRRQDLTRLLSLIAVSLAFVIALGVAWLGRQSIVKPLQILIRDVNRITSRDFSPVTPMSRRDEIGDLSRSVALMTAWLNDSYEAMEARVNERTVELQRRTDQLQVAAQIARDVAATFNLDELLKSAVELIRERFGFYHAGIFLIDARGEYAVLRAATGEAGKEMLNIEHKLSIGGTSDSTGLVGHAVALREAQLARDVDQDPFHFKNPYLPDTRSELVLPLIVAEQIIGVLDVQSQIRDAFDQESITILQVMADQLAIAIQNARLLQEVQENLYELQAAYGRIERQEWARLAKSSPVIGFEFNGIEIKPIQEDSSEKQASTKSFSQNDIKPISIPLQVRGENFGSMEVWPQSDQWSEAEAYLLTTVSNRLSQVLEGARLLQQAQNLASREQQINLIANQMRSASNLDGILKNTVRELGKALGTRRAYIQLGEIKGRNTAESLKSNSFGKDGPEKVTPDNGNSGVSHDGQ